ncbi:MAG: EAL domain-containing protein [Pseudomonadota bacterium]
MTPAEPARAMVSDENAQDGKQASPALRSQRNRIRPGPPNRRSMDERVGSVMQSIGEAAYEWDIAADRLIWSSNAATLFCIEDDAVISTGRDYNGLLVSTSSQNRNEAVLGSGMEDTGNGVSYSVQYALSGEKLGTASDIWLEDSGRWFAGEDGSPTHAHGVVRIINERRAMEERLARLSRFDGLTGLYNRSQLNTTLDAVISEATRNQEPAALILMSLDRFDLVNAIYGYDTGDAIIAEIAGRFRSCLRGGDIIGRISGAKLGLVLRQCSEEEMQQAANRFLMLVRDEVIHTDKGPVALTASAGAVIVPRHARTSRSAMAAAQEALTQARQERHPRFVSFHRDDKAEAERQQAAELASEVVEALGADRMEIAFQPVVDASSRDVAFHEALIRLTTANGQTLSATEFVGTAQDLGLTRLVDHAALDRVLETLRRSDEARLSLNVSNDTASDPEWMSRLSTALVANPEWAKRLIVEITESHVARDLEEAALFVNTLHDLGCQVAIDDFGAGFTSFANLKHLPVDIIKIDGQFVENLTSSKENQCFIKSLVELAKVFNARTVVEWVDDDATAAQLQDWGVDYLQGYRFGKPSSEAPWPMRPAVEVFVPGESR